MRSPRRGTTTGTTAAALTVLLAASLSACGGGGAGDQQVTLEVWRHSGTAAEQAVVESQVAAFNDSHDDIDVTLRNIPEGDYNDELQTASASNALPDVSEIDGPLVANYVYQERLSPLDDLIDPAVLGDLLPSLQQQGGRDGHTYAVGTFDSGLGLYADRTRLEAAGVRLPTGPGDAWTGAEFTRVLAALAADDPDGKVLDVKLNYGVGEWLTYGFAPLVASAGGELIEARSLSPQGHLDGKPARTALKALRSWAPYVDANTEDDAFTTRTAALSWVGHWVYADYAKALGDNLVVLPLPDLGNGSHTGQGSWTWAVSAKTEPHREAAARFLEFLLGTDEVLRMSDANGAVPGTRSALAVSSLYAEDGPLGLFADQLLASCGAEAPDRDCVAVPRPSTPGYPVLSAEFAESVAVALAGKDPVARLRQAADFVADDLAANNGYR